MQWAPELFLTGKATGGEDDQSPISSAEVKNDWSYTSTPAIYPQVLDRDICKFYDTLSWNRDLPHPSRPALAGPPSLLKNGYRVFPGGKGGQGVTLTTHSHLVSRSRKSRGVPLLPLWASVACYRVKPHHT